MSIQTTGRKGSPVLIKFFGKLPGQTLQEFANELKPLTDEDFNQIKQGIESGTLTY